MQIPDTTEALWSQIDKDTKALAELVATTKKDEVYAMAETVEALVNAIPAKYPDLASDKKETRRGTGEEHGPRTRRFARLHGRWEDRRSDEGT